MIRQVVVDECKQKLKLSCGMFRENPLRIIWGWIKQEHITWKEFEILVDFVEEEGLRRKPVKPV